MVSVMKRSVKQSAKLQRLEIYVDPKVAKVLIGLAKVEDRTLSHFVARVLAEYVAATEGR